MTVARFRYDEADIKALLIAPLVPSGVWILLDAISRAVTFGPLYALGALLLGFYVIVVMETISVVVGLPLVRLLKNHLNSAFVCMLVGAAVASIPIVVLSLLGANPDSATSDGVATVEQGHRTIYGYVELVEIIGICSAFGALGGALFWGIRRKLKQREVRKNV